MLKFSDFCMKAENNRFYYMKVLTFFGLICWSTLGYFKWGRSSQLLLLLMSNRKEREELQLVHMLAGLDLSAGHSWKTITLNMLSSRLQLKACSKLLFLKNVWHLNELCVTLMSKIMNRKSQIVAKVAIFFFRNF